MLIHILNAEAVGFCDSSLYYVEVHMLVKFKTCYLGDKIISFFLISLTKRRLFELVFHKRM